MAYRIKSSSGDGSWIIGLTLAALWVVGGIGWICNIVKIVGSVNSEPLSAMFIIRCVGVFAAPLGAILGFL